MMIRHGAYLRGVGDYNGEKCTILLLLVVYKVIDGYADVYESEFQRQGSLYLTGKSNFSEPFFPYLSLRSYWLPLKPAFGLSGSSSGPDRRSHPF